MDELQDLKDMVGAWLAKRLPTPDMIREQIEKVRSVYPRVTDEQAKQVAREFEAVHGVTMKMGATLQEDDDFEQWLDKALLHEFYRVYPCRMLFFGQLLFSTLYDWGLPRWIMRLRMAQPKRLSTCWLPQLRAFSLSPMRCL